MPSYMITKGLSYPRFSISAANNLLVTSQTISFEGAVKERSDIGNSYISKSADKENSYINRKTDISGNKNISGIEDILKNLLPSQNH